MRYSSSRREGKNASHHSIRYQMSFMFAFDFGHFVAQHFHCMEKYSLDITQKHRCLFSTEC